MNERIKELAVKAKLMAEEDINRQISYNTELKAFTEKFAELIVKECANHIAGQLPDERLDDWHEGYHAGVQRSVDCLKDFGVE